MAQRKQNDTPESVEQKEKKPRKKRDPATCGLSPKKYLSASPKDNQKYMGMILTVGKMPRVNLKDPEAVGERIDAYFQLYAEQGMKPTVSGLALALGLTRQELWAIKNNKPYCGDGTKFKLPTLTTDLIKKAYSYMENLMESYMIDGTINPVMGIFMAKNHYGYKDQAEVVTVEKKLDTDFDPESIRNKYLNHTTDSVIDADFTDSTDSE